MSSVMLILLVDLLEEYICEVLYNSGKSPDVILLAIFFVSFLRDVSHRLNILWTVYGFIHWSQLNWSRWYVLVVVVA